MLAILSPAKTLDFDSRNRFSSSARPLLAGESTLLIEELRAYTTPRLAKLLRVSTTLAETNRRRYQDWRPEHDPSTSRPAIQAFDGDVYRALHVSDLTDEEVRFAEKHVRILSGLYGVLRPLDLIQPYRLDMGTALPNPRGKNLYDFWGDRITDALSQAVAAQQDDVLINLASDEYFRSINAARLRARVIKPVFKERKNGGYRVVGLRAKRARGLFCGFLIRNRITHVDELRAFDTAGYGFNDSLSTDSELVFTHG